MYERHITGREGELIAEKYLVKQEYNIIEKNFNCRFGEIDIIATDNLKQEIVFIEVKTRKSFKYGMPSEAVTKIKKKHITKVAEFFIYKNRLWNKFIRFDVIEVIITEKEEIINHIKHAF